MIEILPDGLRVVRRVNAPRADAFDAWVNPDRLRAWFGPVGASVVDVRGELGVGGEYRLRIRGADGHMSELVWTFREIVPPQRLVFGWSVGPRPAPYDDQTVVTITFRERGTATEIELEHSGVTTEDERQMFVSGWDGCFRGLEAILHQAV
jgi:uncharacterized protein YndB with AHSA1/START domain